MSINCVEIWMFKRGGQYRQCSPRSLEVERMMWWMEWELGTGDGCLKNKDTWSMKGHRGMMMRRGKEGPAGETGGQGRNDPGQKTHLEDVLPSPLHIQGVIHLAYRIPGANRSLLILTLLLSFHSFVYPVPLPEETYKPFSWSPVVLPQMIHSQNSPWQIWQCLGKI